MSVGRIELIDGKKQYSEYAGGGNSDTKSEYVYIERFVKTETLINEWKLAAYEYTTICAKVYDVDTGEFLEKEYNGRDANIVKYVPLSFNVIPYADILDKIYPSNTHSVDVGFFAYLGISVELNQGIFKFTNQKKLLENPMLTWYKSYARNGDGGTIDMLKESYPAFLFRGYLRKLETNDPMYIKFGTKTMDDAENNIY
ncbi:hypothetical protein FMM80_25210 [Schaedlerella arabinosiphila]|uniref:Uncharacterized protein n=1 Tax=Schaedlerella arabinosiphila TaxID=2044587 RepID=A0A9X5CBT1_9FIRM|nr:hypothetical protein [Schaedlerella arabinosiphila]KAI4444634.1 hypothetical protein C824_001068 [Schaedlerella arabinosiphila]NDO71775.1 hypothetical protein [Schaedlerella arabinosiphila]